jgi:hypothetical protein
MVSLELEQRGKLDSGGAPAKWSPELSPVSLTAVVTPAKHQNNF